MIEHDIQNEIRKAVSTSGAAILFRGNVAEAWTGSKIDKNLDGSITIHNPRKINTGLPDGFSDLFGTRIEDGRSVFIEVKRPKQNPTEKQANFLAVMANCQALSGVAHSAEEALAIIKGGDID